jgi:hypothetical protein
MIDEKKRFARKWSWPKRDTIPSNGWSDREITKNLSQDSWCPGQDSNQVPPGYEPTELSLG